MTTTTTAYTLGCKGLETTHTLGTGDMLIQGYLTRWSDLDREADRFVRGSFLASIPKFLTRASGSPLCWAHQKQTVIGRVLSLEEDQTGVLMKAVVNAQQPTSPLRWIYEAIKTRSARGLSVGGFFRRSPCPDGSADIHGVDILECSVAATPMLESAGFEVVSEGKALSFGWATGRTGELDELAADVRRMSADAAVGELRAGVAVARRAVATANARQAARDRVRREFDAIYPRFWPGA